MKKSSYSESYFIPIFFSPFNDTSIHNYLTWRPNTLSPNSKSNAIKLLAFGRKYLNCITCPCLTWYHAQSHTTSKFNSDLTRNQWDILFFSHNPFLALTTLDARFVEIISFARGVFPKKIFAEILDKNLNWWRTSAVTCLFLRRRLTVENQTQRISAIVTRNVFHFSSRLASCQIWRPIVVVSELLFEDLMSWHFVWWIMFKTVSDEPV